MLLVNKEIAMKEKMLACSRCGETKSINGFGKNRSRPNGLSAYCAECMRGTHRRWRQGNPDYYANYRRKYRRDNKMKCSEAYMRNRLKYPEKVRAREIVSCEIRNNRLVPQPCEMCNKTPSEGHHEDYSKPLDVKWLCREHHLEHSFLP